MAATDLQALCEEFLAACAAALVDTPGGPIDEQFVSSGIPVWDCCPQLTVHTGGPQIGETRAGPGTLAPGHRHAVTGTLNLVSLTATVLRCVTIVTVRGAVALPTRAELNEDANKTNADVWSIWNYLSTAKRNGTLFAPGTREMMLDPAVSLVTHGGCGGWQIPIRVELHGYRNPSA